VRKKLDLPLDVRQLTNRMPSNVTMELLNQLTMMCLEQ
jgi:hypothetical protein